MRDSQQDAEVTKLLRERDRIDVRLEELGVHMPPRPGGITMAEWDMHGPDGRLRTRCGHSLAWCHTDHCFHPSWPVPTTADDKLPALGDV